MGTPSQEFTFGNLVFESTMDMIKVLTPTPVRPITANGERASVGSGSSQGGAQATRGGDGGVGFQKGGGSSQGGGWSSGGGSGHQRGGGNSYGGGTSSGGGYQRGGGGGRGGLSSNLRISQGGGGSFQGGGELGGEGNSQGGVSSEGDQNGGGRNSQGGWQTSRGIPYGGGGTSQGGSWQTSGLNSQGGGSRGGQFQGSGGGASRVVGGGWQPQQSSQPAETSQAAQSPEDRMRELQKRQMELESKLAARAAGGGHSFVDEQHNQFGSLPNAPRDLPRFEGFPQNQPQHDFCGGDQNASSFPTRGRFSQITTPQTPSGGVKMRIAPSFKSTPQSPPASPSPYSSSAPPPLQLHFSSLHPNSARTPPSDPPPSKIAKIYTPVASSYSPTVVAPSPPPLSSSTGVFRPPRVIQPPSSTNYVQTKLDPAAFGSYVSLASNRSDATAECSVRTSDWFECGDSGELSFDSFTKHIPGPAGQLVITLDDEDDAAGQQDARQTTNLPEIDLSSISNLPPPINPMKKRYGRGNVFTKGPWLAMCSMYDQPPVLEDSDDPQCMVRCMNCENVLHHGLGANAQKIHTMAVVILKIRSLPVGCVALVADPTGVLEAEVHDAVLNPTSGFPFTEGCVVVLKNVTVFCPTFADATGPSLIITEQNILQVFDLDEPVPMIFREKLVEISKRQGEIALGSLKRSGSLTVTTGKGGGGVTLPMAPPIIPRSMPEHVHKSAAPRPPIASTTEASSTQHFMDENTQVSRSLPVTMPMPSHAVRSTIRRRWETDVDVIEVEDELDDDDDDDVVVVVPAPVPATTQFAVVAVAATSAKPDPTMMVLDESQSPPGLPVPQKTAFVMIQLAAVTASETMTVFLDDSQSQEEVRVVNEVPVAKEMTQASVAVAQEANVAEEWDENMEAILQNMERGRRSMSTTFEKNQDVNLLQPSPVVDRRAVAMAAAAVIESQSSTITFGDIDCLDD